MGTEDRSLQVLRATFAKSRTELEELNKTLSAGEKRRLELVKELRALKIIIEMLARKHGARVPELDEVVLPEERTASRKPLGTTIAEGAQMVLEQAEEPLTVPEIAERMQIRGHELPDDRKTRGDVVRSALRKANGVFVQVDKKRWALKEGQSLAG